MLRKIKKIIGCRIDKNFLYKENFKEGYKKFIQTGKTSDEAFYAFIKMYCVTNGAYFEDFNKRLKHTNPPKPINETLSGVAGVFTKEKFAEVNKEMNEKGYAFFDKKLNKDVCQRLTQFALNTPATIPPKYDEPIIYNPGNLLGEVYRFNISDIINNVDVQQLMMDPVLLNFARNYLECEPIFDFPALWWSTTFQKEASSEAAQLFHFDLDRVKWLKVFFYINDVTPENGPHCYIEGSHKPNSKPAELLKRGYVRISDEDLKPYYKPDAIKTVCGEAGSMFIGDTKCWHKGMPLKKGHRLVLEFEYTSSLFGTNYPKLVVTKASKDFKDFCTENKTFATNIHFSN
jgi:hypothetical protein